MKTRLIRWIIGCAIGFWIGTTWGCGDYISGWIIRDATNLCTGHGGVEKAIHTPLSVRIEVECKDGSLWRR